MSRIISLTSVLMTAVLILTGCTNPPVQKAPKPPPLPHLRYFESFAGKTDITLTLYDIDLNNQAKTSIWQLADRGIDKAELTPEGRYILLRYKVNPRGDEPLQYYYVVYDLDSDTSSTPLEFTRGDKPSQRIKGYDVFIDDDDYKLGFVVGDPDITNVTSEPVSIVYKFAWVDLVARNIEEIPLVINWAEVPDIIFVPIGAGYFDFIMQGKNQIWRFFWDSSDRQPMKTLYDPNKDPVIMIQYIGSFSYFGDFEKPGREESDITTAKVGIRTPESLISLPRGDFPLWSIGERYIFLRVFPSNVMDLIAEGQGGQAFGQLYAQKEPSKFAIYDVKESKRKDISLTLADPTAMPNPIYDATSDILAVEGMDIPSDDKDNSTETPPSSKTVLVYSIDGDKVIATFSGIPAFPGVSSPADFDIAFYRP